MRKLKKILFSRQPEIKKFFKRLAEFVKHPFLRKNEPILHTVEWIFILFAFFVIGIGIILFQTSRNLSEKQVGIQEDGVPIKAIKPQKEFIGEILPEPIDISNWDTYQNKWYGFEIQHPDSWKNNTQYKTATEKSAVYEIIYKFRKKGDLGDNAFEGYDVRIYPLKKVQSIENTNDVHEKENMPENQNDCKLPVEEIKNDNELAFQKVSIDEDNPCYEPAYFYSVTKGDYIYNIVPAVGESGARYAEPEKKTNSLFPEYKEAVNSFKLIAIARPKPKLDPRIGVRKPVGAKIVNGKLVCAKKNDKPRKSKQNKPGHLDLECCLDPDERPNPWCTY